MNPLEGAGAAPAPPRPESALPAMPIKMTGSGHAVGTATESNERLAESLGLESNWFTKRTGITEYLFNERLPAGKPAATWSEP